MTALITDTSAALAALAAAPVGAPGPWTVFIDFLGGDDIAVQAAPSVAIEFVTEALGLDLSHECGCDWRCGPTWSEREGPGRDGSYPTRPALVHDDQGLRWDGTHRSSVYSAEPVATALASREVPVQASAPITVPIPSP